jgi:ATP-binding cassette subfamily B protein
MTVQERGPGEETSDVLDGSGEEPVLISEVADLIAEEDHRYGKREVRVTKSRVSVYDGAGALLLTVPMSDIKSARTEPLVGGARLELTTTSGVLPVAEFSASVAARFSEMARGIEQLAKGEELAIKLKFERTRCAKCGRLLPEKDGRCPACVKRAAVLKRILSYMKPYKGRAVAVALLSLAATSVTLINPLLTQMIADNVLNS